MSSKEESPISGVKSWVAAYCPNIPALSSVKDLAMIHILSFLVSALALVASPALAQGGFLGVSLENPQAGTQGARIASVQERSAASIMGLRTGDLVTGVDGLTVADSAALAALIRSRLPGEIVELDVQRDGTAQKVLGVLARRPGARAIHEPDPSLFGLGQVPQPPEGWPQAMQGFDFNFEELEISAMQPFLDLQLQDLQPQLEDLQRRLQQVELRLKPGADGFGFRFHGDPSQIFLQPGIPLKAGDGTSIQLRYPESTPPEERERLLQEAVEKYGEKVVVEFAGTGTSVTIQRHSLGAADSAPETGKNREF